MTRVEIFDCISYNDSDTIHITEHLLSLLLFEKNLTYTLIPHFKQRSALQESISNLDLANIHVLITFETVLSTTSKPFRIVLIDSLVVGVGHLSSEIDSRIQLLFISHSTLPTRIF
jgi:hypothetical protein